MLKRVAAASWSAIMMLLSGALAVARLSTGTVGTADDLRNLQNPTWWEQALAWLLSVPAWIPVTAFFVFAAIFAVQLVIDGRRGTEALRTVKSSNERAWAFEPEFRATIDRFKSAISDVAETKKTIVAIHEALGALQRNQDFQRDFLERLKPNVLLINCTIPTVLKITSDLEHELYQYVTKQGGIEYPHGIVYPSSALTWAQDRFTIICRESGLSGDELQKETPHVVYREKRKRTLGISLELEPAGQVDTYINWIYRYEQIYKRINQKLSYDFMHLREAPLRQSLPDTETRTPL